jgi:hypothetical protein
MPRSVTRERNHAVLNCAKNSIAVSTVNTRPPVPEVAFCRNARATPVGRATAPPADSRASLPIAARCTSAGAPRRQARRSLSSNTSRSRSFITQVIDNMTICTPSILIMQNHDRADASQARMTGRLTVYAKPWGRRRGRLASSFLRAQATLAGLFAGEKRWASQTQKSGSPKM